MKKISLITVYNNHILMEKMINSAQTQKNVEIDYVMIDNTARQFSSAAGALNYGLSKSTGEVVVFLHQDMEFLNPMVLDNIYNYIIAHKDTIIGSAGVKQKKNSSDKTPILSSMKNEYGRYDTLKAPEKVFTLDECLIACHRNCMEKISFDEKICDGWHLYAADLCIQAQAFEKMSVYAVPMDVWHKSSGCADKAYYTTQKKLAAKYKKYFKIINTTNGWVYTSPIKCMLHSVYRRIRYGGEVE